MFEWHKRHTEAPKLRMPKSRVKTVFTAFLYAKSIIHQEFVPEKQTANGKFHKEVIEGLIARVHRVRPEFQESGSWYLLHDDAPAHSSGVVSEFLAKRGIPVLSHPHYSPDFTLSEFFYSLN
jgi:hypothetical protein